MHTNIKTTGITLTEDISTYINKRLEKVEKLLDNDPAAQCDIELARTSEHHQKGLIFRADIHIVGAGKNCYSSSQKSDLLSAIDDIRDEILRELKAGKGKRISVIRRSGARVKDMLKGMWPWGRKV